VAVHLAEFLPGEMLVLNFVLLGFNRSYSLKERTFVCLDKGEKILVFKGIFSSFSDVFVSEEIEWDIFTLAEPVESML